MRSKAAITAHLTSTDIEPFASRYLHEGRKAEDWRIVTMDIADRQIAARVSMSSTYASPTDAKGFHLTVFTTLEFASELMLIYAHVWAGLQKKTREGWMVESAARCVRAIRDPEAIEVTMSVRSIRQRGETLFCVAEYQITDRFDGLFEVRLKGFLS